MNDITNALTRIAISQSIPFCYGCYTRAPSGQCTSCLADDLMFELPGVAVEYGTDWMLRQILQEHLTYANTLEAFEQSVAEFYPETVKIGWIEYDTVSALKELDPVSWNMAHSEWIDTEICDGNLITYDNGLNHYWVSDLEQFIEDFGQDRNRF
ncbi:MAG: hypothetical protein AB7T49_19955 [Oligoflexales bacterium]